MEFILYIRKPWFVFIFILMFFFSHAFSQDQGKGIHFIFNNKPLEQVLKYLIKEYRLSIIYQDSQVKDILISARCSDCDMNEALNSILKDTDLKWKKVRHQIVIFKEKVKKINGDKKKINGQVIDSKDKEPLPYTNIMLKGKMQGTVSDSMGLFSFLNVPAKHDTFQVYHIGYRSKEISTYSAGEKDLLKVELDEDTLYTDRIMVTGIKNHSFEISEKQAGSINFSPQSIGALPSLGAADYQRTMQMIPGISGRTDKMSELSMLGDPFQCNLIYLDGIPVCGKSELYFGMLSPFHTRFIEDITIYKAGYPACYGDCIGGVIELKGNTVRDNRFNAGVGADLFQMNGYVQIPISDKLRCFSAVNKSFNHITHGPRYNDVYHVASEHYISPSYIIGKNKDYTFYRTVSKLYCEPSNKNWFSFTFYTGKEKQLLEEEWQDQLEWQDTGLSTQCFQQWNSIVSSDLTFSFARNIYQYFYHYNSTLFEDSIYSDWKREYIDQDEKQKTTIKLINRIETGIARLNVGGEIVKEKYRSTSKVQYHLPPEDSQYLSRLYVEPGIKLERFKHGLFMESSWIWKKRVEYSLGFRSVNFSSSSKIYTMPRSSFSVFLSDQITLNGTWGKYYQFPVFSGFFLFYYHDIYSCKPGWSEPFLINLNYQPKDYHLNIEIYYKKLHNIASVLLDDFYMWDFMVNFGKTIYKDGNIRGFGLSLQKKKGKFSGWFCYNYNQSNYNVTCTSLRDYESMKGFYSFIENQRTHELKAIFMIRIGKWDISTAAVFDFHSQHMNYSVDRTDDIVDELDQRAETPNAYKRSYLPYKRIDIKLSRTFNNILYMKWEFGVSLLNVFNWQNYVDYIYMSDNNTELTSPPIMTFKKWPLSFMPLAFLNISYR